MIAARTRAQKSSAVEADTAKSGRKKETVSPLRETSGALRWQELFGNRFLQQNINTLLGCPHGEPANQATETSEELETTGSLGGLEPGRDSLQGGDALTSSLAPPMPEVAAATQEGAESLGGLEPGRDSLQGGDALTSSHSPPMPEEATATQERADLGERDSSSVEARSIQEEQTETAATGLIIEDSAETVETGQMKRTEFLTELRSQVEETAESALAETGRTTEDCPYIRYWFDYYSTRASRDIERAVRRYAPEAADARTAEDYVRVVTERIQRAVRVWAETGRVTGVPEGVPTAVPGGEKVETAEPVLRKGISDSGAVEGNPQGIRANLGEGSPLEPAVRDRMETAFRYPFNSVRVHDNADAAHLSSSFGARAFTLGTDVAFGAGEYRPGTLLGDALIAHELAHVVQQGGSEVTGPLPKGDSHGVLEDDADVAAVNAVLGLWGGLRSGVGNLAPEALPRLRSGLRLQRCSSRSGQTPKSLRHISTRHQPDATWGYLTLITYEVLDDRGTPINGFDVNEKWSTGQIKDDATSDWRRGPEGSSHMSGTQFTDNIGGESSTHTPTPQSPQSPLGNHKIDHWGQEWYIGSLTPGRGTKVQTNTLQKYQDHAAHDNVQSPP